MTETTNLMFSARPLNIPVYSKALQAAIPSQLVALTSSCSLLAFRFSGSLASLRLRCPCMLLMVAEKGPRVTGSWLKPELIAVLDYIYIYTKVAWQQFM